MSDAWVAVAGTVIGGVLGVASTLITQVLQQRATREARDAERKREEASQEAKLRREDHVRYLEERKRLYASWAESATEVTRALGDWLTTQQLKDLNPLSTRTFDDGRREALRASAAQMDRAAFSIGLIARKEVRDSISTFTDQVVQLELDLNGLGDRPREEALMGADAPWEQLDQTLSAMRGDLGIVDQGA
jgi:gas vesicle protein